MQQFTAEELKNKTDDELSVLGERHHPLSAEGILIKNELQRRLIVSTGKKEKWYKEPLAFLIGVAASLVAAALWYHYGPK
jgi:hypothetical protein